MSSLINRETVPPIPPAATFVVERAAIDDSNCCCCCNNEDVKLVNPVVAMLGVPAEPIKRDDVWIPPDPGAFKDVTDELLDNRRDVLEEIGSLLATGGGIMPVVDIDFCIAFPTPVRSLNELSEL